MSSDPIVIVSAARTPIGGLLGDFSALQAWQLGATAIKAAVERGASDLHIKAGDVFRARIDGKLVAMTKQAVDESAIARRGSSPCRVEVARSSFQVSSDATTRSTSGTSGRSATTLTESARGWTLISEAEA